MLAVLQEAGAALPETGIALETEGFSLIGLLLEADPIVKAVLVILTLASVWSWAIILEKLFTLGSARKKAKSFEDDFWSGSGEMMEARPGAGGSPGARVFGAIAQEWNDARRGNVFEGQADTLVSRAERSMRAAIDREVGRQSGGLGILAAIGSSSVFIGLFGTVWGIMNAFLKIGQQQDASLVTTAGPIAEALFATGLGLVAAIPATIFYNKFSTDLNRMADQLDTFSQDVLVRLSRLASEPARR